MSNNFQKLENKIQSVAKGKQGVISAHPLATQAGIDCLKKGGNAYDALVASAITLTVVEPMMSGALGCGIAMLNSPKKGNIVCNFSGLIPNNFNQDNWDDTRSDALSILSPSTVNAWLEINKRFGAIPFDQLCEPAIEYAENGFELTEANNFFINFAKNSDSKKLFDTYYKKSFKTGDIFTQKKTAVALRLIAQYQEEVLLNSPLSKAISLTLKNVGSSLSLEDIKKDQISWQTPLSTEVFAHQVNVPPRNSNGFMILQAAKLIEESKVCDMTHNSAVYIDLLVKTLKKVFSNANNFKINQSINSGHTTTILTHDSSENTAIMTQTLGGLYGSGIWVDDFGLPLNGLGAYCFDELPKVSKKIKDTSTKRAPNPMSLVQIFKNNKLEYAFGTPGGFTIIQTELQVLLNILVFKMPLDKAIDAPRFFIDDREDISIEDRTSDSVIRVLVKMGYKPKILDAYSWVLGCMQGFKKSETSLFVADSRRHAKANAI